MQKTEGIEEIESAKVWNIANSSKWNFSLLNSRPDWFCLTIPLTAQQQIRGGLIVNIDDGWNIYSSINALLLRRSVYASLPFSLLDKTIQFFAQKSWKADFSTFLEKEQAKIIEIRSSITKYKNIERRFNVIK